MPKHLIVVEDAKDWPREEPVGTVVHFRDYLLSATGSSASRIINLCRGYPYQGNGYYCSLMAEARGLPTADLLAVVCSRETVSGEREKFMEALSAAVTALML